MPTINSNVTFSAPVSGEYLKYTVDIAGYTSGIQAKTLLADAITLSIGWNSVDTLQTSAHGKFVKLPAYTSPGQIVNVRNNTSYDIKVNAVGSDRIDGGSAAGYYYLASGSIQKFVTVGLNSWVRLVRGLRFVSRYVTVQDYSATSAAAKNWTDLDLTSIIPPSAYGKPIDFELYISDNDTATDYMCIRRKGASTEWYVGPMVKVLGASAGAIPHQQYKRGTVHCDVNGYCQIYTTDLIDGAAYVVTGWWIEG